MTTACEAVRERIAAGEERGEDQAHLGECDECRAAAATVERVRGAVAARGAVEPGPGFEARMIARALEKARRRRAAQLTLAVGVVAAVILGVVMLRRSGSDEHRVVDRPPTDQRRDDAPAVGDHVPAIPRQLTAEQRRAVASLLELSDVKRSLRFRASWDAVEAPIADMQLLTPGLKGDER
jgi:negative regulator of sigma E activity